MNPDDLLNDLPPRRSQSQLSRMPELQDAIRCFFEAKRSGDERVEHISFTWFYLNKLQPHYGGPTIEAVRRFVRTHMKIDTDTGATRD